MSEYKKTNLQRIPIPALCQEVIDELYPGQESARFKFLQAHRGSFIDYKVSIENFDTMHNLVLWMQLHNSHTQERLAEYFKEKLRIAKFEERVVIKVEALGGQSDWYDENGVLQKG